MMRTAIPIAAIALLAACSEPETHEDLEIDTTAPSAPFDDDVSANTILEEEAVPNPAAEPGDALDTGDDS